MLKNKNISGFTLIELLVTVSIIGILSSVAIVGLSSTRQKAQDTSYLSSIRDLQLSLEAYKSVNGSYPDAGADGSADYIVGLTPSFITKLPTGGSQTGTGGFDYTVDDAKKTYCVYVRNVVFKPESQKDLAFAQCPNTWVACKGKDTASLNTCD